MNHLASSPDSSYHFGSVFFVELFRTVIACYNESLMCERDGASFGFSRACVMVTPDFEIVTEAGVIMIV